jgi:excisionase family DNA binding protein
MKTNGEPLKLLKYEEAADFLGLAPTTLRRWVSKEKIPYVKLGGAVRFNPAALARFIEARSVPMGGSDES